MNILQKLKEFYLQFNGKKGVIGYSVLNKPIYYFRIEKSTYPKIIVQYCIHAREYITTYLALKQIEDFALNGLKGCVYFIPMMNPDGVEISLKSKPLYKANAKGVDLNVNFDANWGSGRYNTTHSGSQNYIGKYPFSEPETIALRDFTYKINPNVTISYHSKGEEIYWEFFQHNNQRQRDYALAVSLQKGTGYTIKSTPDSAGGYKDWCIKTLGIPAFTIEVGSDKLKHPINKKHLPQIYKANKSVINTITESDLWK